MYEVIDELAGYVCEKLCKVPESGRAQEVVDLFCNNCRMTKYVEEIKSTNAIVDELYLNKCKKVNRLETQLNKIRSLVEGGLK